MALLISSAALFLLAHFLSNLSAPPGDTPIGAITSKWSSDLRAAVGSAPLGLVVGHGHETHSQPRTSLWFLDKNTIIATFVTNEGKPALSSRGGSDANLPLRLRVVFLDVSTGKITATPAWPTESRFAGIVATYDGKFVAQTGTTLTSYSADARTLGKLSLPPIEEDVLGWGAHPSPTGRSILFATTNLTTTVETPWIWVDSNSLRIAHSWKGIRTGWVGISDNAIAMTSCVIWFYHCDPNVAIRGLATEWKPVAPIERRSQPFPQFVSEDILFLSGHPWKVLQTDGKVVLTESAPFEGSLAIPSAGGQRFVVPFFKLTGEVAPLDVGAHGELKTISVYDSPFHERSYKLKVIGPKIKDQGTQLALSSDGSLLAILHDEWVYVFQLPPAPPQPAQSSKTDGASHRE
jgi:hypothetical protein